MTRSLGHVRVADRASGGSGLRHRVAAPGAIAARAARVRGPTPRSLAWWRSAPVSTSRRTDVIGTGVSSTAPASRCARRDGPPNLGAKSTPGAVQYSVVPTPAASGTNDVGQAAAASSAVVSSFGRRAGRSASMAATAPSGRRERASRAPCSSAAFSPAAGSSVTATAPTPARTSASSGSGSDRQQLDHSWARESRGDGVDRHRLGEFGAMPTGERCEPGLSDRGGFHGHHQAPADGTGRSHGTFLR